MTSKTPKLPFNSTIIVSLLVLVSLSIKPLNAQITLDYHADLNMDALRFWYADPNKPVSIFNRDISPKGDCLKVMNGYLFLTWYKGGMTERNLMLSRMNLSTKQWVTIEFPDKNTLYSGDYHGTDMTGAGDSHRTAAVGICPIDGTVHLAYDMHVDPINYRVSNKNIAFAPDSEFTLANFSERRDYLKPGTPIPNFTYPSFLTNDAGEVIVEYRLGTSRQGDKYITYYDGNEWSDIILLIKGNNENPQFNQYGDFSYQFGKMYLGCAIREYASPITNNQGFYFAEAGQRGNEDWKNLQGQTFSIPIRGLNQMNNFKICEPLPEGNDGMTSSPQLVVSKNGAVHMTNRVPGIGTVHYYTNVGSRTLIKGSGSTYDVTFGGEDQRVYSISLLSGRIRILSTPEGQNNWRTDYLWGGSQRFGIMSSYYYNGKIYIIAAEDINSDKRPMHLIILNLKINPNDIYSSIPGKIEAENYSAMAGVQTVETFNEDSDSAIAFTDDNSWVEYNVTVDKTGSYDIAYRVASQTDSIKCQVTVDGSAVSFLNEDSTGGSQTWQTVTGSIDLQVGKHKLRILGSGDWNLNWINVTTTIKIPPVVTLETPSNDSTNYADYSLYVKANASDTDGSITSVKLYIDDNLIREVKVAPYEWGHASSPDPNELNGLPVGDHTFKVVATDNDGLTGEDTFTFTVLEDFYKNKVTPCSAKASTPTTSHSPEMAFDGDYSEQSYWSGSGKGATLIFDLCKPYKVQKLGITWLYGERWSYKYDLAYSTDSVNWTPLLTNQVSSKIGNHDIIDFEPFVGRYIRYTGNGNTITSLNAVIEFDVYGEASNAIKAASSQTIEYLLYPNPAKSQFSITCNTATPFDLCIYNVLGEKVYEAKGINTTHSVNTSQTLAGGTYLLVFKRKDMKPKTQKIVIL